MCDRRIMAIRSLLGTANTFNELKRPQEARKVLLLAFRLVAYQRLTAENGGKDRPGKQIPRADKLVAALRTLHLIDRETAATVKALTGVAVPTADQLAEVYSLTRTFIIAEESTERNYLGTKEQREEVAG